MSDEFPVPAEISVMLGDMSGATPTPASGVAEQTLDNVATHDFAFHEFLFDFQKAWGAPGALSAAGEAYLSAVRSDGIDEITVLRLRSLIQPLESACMASALAAGATSAVGTTWLQLPVVLYQSPSYVGFLHLIDSRANDLRGLMAVLLEEIQHYLSPQNTGRTTRPWFDIMRRAFPAIAQMWDFAGYPGYDADGVQLLESNAFTQQAIPTRKPQQGIVEWWFSHMVRLRAAPGTSKVTPYDFETAPLLSTNLGLRLTYRQAWRPLALQKGELVRTVPLGPGQKERISTKIISRRKDTSTNESKKETETSSESTNTTKDSTEVVAEAASSFNWNVSAKVSGTYGFVSGEVAGGSGGASEDKSKNTSSSLSEAVSKTASKMRTETKVVVSTEIESTYEQERASEINNSNSEIAVTYEYYKLQQQYEVFTQMHRVEGVIYVAENIPSPLEVNTDWIRRYDWILAKVLKDESFREALTAVSREVDEDADPLAGQSDPFRSMLDQASTKFAQFSTGSAASPAGVSIPDIYAAPQQSYRERLQDIATRTRGNTLKLLQRERLLQHLRDNILHYCRAIWAEEDHDQRLLRYRKEGRRVPGEWIMTGNTVNGRIVASGWQPSGVTVPLLDLIDPLGPLGYVGNYSVWALKPTGALPRFEIEGSLFTWTVGGINPNAQQPGGFTITADIAAVLMIARGPYVDTANGGLLDPALAASRREAGALTAAQLAALSDAQVWDFLTYFPEFAPTMLTATSPKKPVRATSGALTHPPTAEQWAQYLYRSNGTRRFLMDSDNVYLALRTGEGAALEPFKRAHRYVDVLRAAEGLVADQIKNKRRETLIDDPAMFDPDIQKVVVTGGGASISVDGPDPAPVNPTPP